MTWRVRKRWAWAGALGVALATLTMLLVPISALVKQEAAG